MGGCLPKHRVGDPSHCQGCLHPLLQFGPMATALTLCRDSSAASNTLLPYQITTLWACIHARAKQRVLQIAHLTQEEVAEMAASGSALLVSATESQVAPPHTQLCSLQHSSAWKDQLRRQQSPLW